MRVVNLKQLDLDSWQDPRWMIIFATEWPDSELLRGIRQRFPKLAIFGSSSFHGIFTQYGYQQGVFGLLNEGSESKTRRARFIACDDDADWQALAYEAALELGPIDNPERDVILMQATPGHEERIIDGVIEALGENTHIFGGSAGHSRELAKPFIIFGEEICTSGFWLISLRDEFAPQCLMLMGGYLPTLNSGVVTQSSGRVIHTIDFRPAVEVYNEWTNAVFEPYLRRGGDLPKHTAMYPLGRTLDGEPHCGFWLYHPISVTLGTKSLTLFAEFPVNTRITMMRGSERMLIHRMHAVTQEALDSVDASRVMGAIVIFCAGCATIIQDDMKEVCAHVQEVLGDIPFIGCSSLGEQGRIRGFKRSYHGNMMCGVILFMKQDVVSTLHELN
ncbi:MAG: FIST signal transduction protein [Bradymonadia bacterium]|jgi:hypothetical protein